MKHEEVMEQDELLLWIAEQIYGGSCEPEDREGIAWQEALSNAQQITAKVKQRYEQKKPDRYGWNKAIQEMAGLDRPELTDWIYNSLKEIETEEEIKLSNRAFIADHLAPKLQALIPDNVADGYFRGRQDGLVILEANVEEAKLEGYKTGREDLRWGGYKDKKAELIEEAKKQIAHDLFEEIICPMCYRLNPQHASMDNGKGCHYCQEREDWQALKGEK